MAPETIRRAARWLTDKYILAMVLVFPLFWGFWGYTRLTLSKFLFFAVGTGLWLLSLLALGLWYALRLRRLPRLGLRGAHVCVLGFLAWACVSAVCSPYGNAVLLGAGRYDGLLTLALYAGIFLGVSRTAAPRRRYVLALAASTGICAAVALGQLLGLDPLGLFPGSYTYYDAGIRYSGAFLGTIGNTNLLSAFLSLSLPILCAAAVVQDRIPAALLVPAGLGMAVLSASRVSGGLLALAVCTGVSAPVLLRTRRRLFRGLAAGLTLGIGALLGLGLGETPPPSPAILWPLLLTPGIPLLLSAARRRPDTPEPCLPRILGAMLALSVLGGLTLLWFWPGTEGTLYEFHCVLHGVWDDSFGSSRVRIWRETLALVRERPLLGGGPDTLPLRLDVQFSRYVPETGQTLRSSVDNAHNEFLGYLVNLGAPALACYLGAMVLSLRRWVRAGGKSCLLPALGCGLLGYWVQSFFGLGLCVVVPLVWLCWGLLESCPLVFSSRTQYNESIAPSEDPNSCTKEALSMSSDPIIAGKGPVTVDLEAGKEYVWCSCGLSGHQPFCDSSHFGTTHQDGVHFTPEKSGKAHLCMCKRTKTPPYCDGSHTKLDK